MTETIIYIGGFELPDKNAAAHRVINNAKALRELGKNVILIGITHDKVYCREEICGFRCYIIPYPSTLYQWIKYLTGITQYIDICNTYKNISAIIFYNFPSISLKRMIHYCRKNNIHCFGDITEWYSVRGGGIAYALLKGGDTFYRMRILNKKLDGRIVISRYLYKYYKGCGNTVYIPPLVDISEDKWRNSYEKSDKILKLVYAGNPGLKDRIEILIGALQDVKRNYHLDVLGISLDEYLMRMPQHKDFLQDNKSIIFHGRKPHLEVLEYIKKANYSCFFRTPERSTMAGFPTKFTEAISCGTPVITNSTSDLSEYHLNGVNGYLVNSLNQDTIVRVLENVPFLAKTQIDQFDYHKYKEKIKQCISKID